MPSESQEDGEFAVGWRSFVSALKRLLSGALNERVLDPFLALRDATLGAMESTYIVGDLQNAWMKLHVPEGANKKSVAPNLAHLLLTEVTAFPPAVEIAEAEEDATEITPLTRKRLLGIGQTVVESAGDILEMSPIAKGVLRVAREVIGIIRGD